MPIIAEYEYLKVKSMEEALKIKSEYGNKAKVIAGGTDLIPLLKENYIRPEILIDLKGLKEIYEIKIKNNFIR
ncbi:MAG TPA: FAD binding domain-containing protein, partial [Elusimicrobiales bacterium]|nr:FAD binding domain-containing protein [Elusimicrobiales bacterium]